MLFTLLLGAASAALGPALPHDIEAVYPSLDALYQDLHASPELSLHETRTAEKMAAGLRKLGIGVTSGVGGTGVVGVLKNGTGPVVMLRTELDALPIEEATSLPFASHARGKDATGASVGLMHACGHDIHMASWVGTATLMAANKNAWHGTIVFVAQPAEEIGKGARAMLDAGLYTRFPRPDFALAAHDTNKIAAGQVGTTPGYALSNSDAVDITIYGKGGHGAAPYATVDPIVIAARTVVTLQTIVAREMNPLDPAVITVGSIHGGSKHNIIPDEVRLQLTVRSYRDEVRDKLLGAIKRIANAEAAAAGAPREPTMSSTSAGRTTYNDPKLTARVTAALRRELGEGNVVDQPPEMVSEDFSEYGRAGVPALTFWVGSAEPGKFKAAQAGGPPVPGMHSPQFTPDRVPTIKTAVRAEIAALLELLGKP